jgi:ribosomal 50S subunit-associated protein YjgA (DUF615 family)
LIERKLKEDEIKKKSKKWSKRKQIAIKRIGTKFERLKNGRWVKLKNICNFMDHSKL